MGIKEIVNKLPDISDELNDMLEDIDDFKKSIEKLGFEDSKDSLLDYMKNWNADIFEDACPFFYKIDDTKNYDEIKPILNELVNTLQNTKILIDISFNDINKCIPFRKTYSIRDYDDNVVGDVLSNLATNLFIDQIEPIVDEIDLDDDMDELEETKEEYYQNMRDFKFYQFDYTNDQYAERFCEISVNEANEIVYYRDINLDELEHYINKEEAIKIITEFGFEELYNQKKKVLLEQEKQIKDRNDVER